jgi:putative hydrolase of the HAD superfamily
MEQITTVIFDIHNTLLSLQIDEQTVEPYRFLANWLSYKGLAIDPLAFRDTYENYSALEQRHGLSVRPLIDVGEIFDAVLSHAGLEHSITKAMLISELALMFRILTTQSLEMYPEIPDVLTRLQSHGLRLAIISNTQRLFSIPELRKFDLEKYFELILVSSDIKACKPDPEIFQVGIEKLGIAPEEAVYVGDNLFDDVWGAQRVGLHTVWIKRPIPYVYPSGWQAPTPDKTICGTELHRLPETIFSMLA